MDSRSITATILFADIVDSSRLYREHPAEGARGIVLACLDAMSLVTQETGGVVVDRIGDELMCRFDASAGLTIGGALHRAVAGARALDVLPPHMKIRVGFHHGSVLLEQDRVFGETVHVARGIASLAKADQVLTTGATLRALPKDESVAVRELGPTTVKGQRGKFELVEILWDPASATRVRPTPGIAPPAEPTLRLILGSEQHTLNAQRPAATLGRDADCDFIVDHPSVSRLHARIELRGRGFVLIDASTNGTHMRDDRGRARRLHREEVFLEGQGAIHVATDEAGEALPPPIAYQADRP